MPLVPMRQILDEAAGGGYAVGAFSVNNMEQIQAVVQAAGDTNSPVIIQASRGTLNYTRRLYLKKLMEAAVEAFPHLPIALHLDYGNSVETCMQAIQLGFTSVMINGSMAEDGKTPNSYEANLAVTKRVVEIAHLFGVTVEGDMGVPGGIDDGDGAGLSDGEFQDNHSHAERAEEFVARTGVDALAVAPNTAHGAYKTTRRDPVTGACLPPAPSLDRIFEIHARMPHCHIALRGASSLSEALVGMVNQFGGRVPGVFGTPVETIQEAIRHGVRKVNIDTDCRLAMTGAIRRVFAETPGSFDPRDYLAPAREAACRLCVDRMTAFGQAGHATDYRPMTLADARTLYR